MEGVMNEPDGLYYRAKVNEGALYKLASIPMVNTGGSHGVGYAAESVSACQEGNTPMRRKLINYLLNKDGTNGYMDIFNVMIDLNLYCYSFTREEFMELQTYFFRNYDVFLDFVKANREKEYVKIQVGDFLEDTEEYEKNRIFTKDQIASLKNVMH